MGYEFKKVVMADGNVLFHTTYKNLAGTEGGAERLWSETTQIDPRVAEVANPRPGDRIEIDPDIVAVMAAEVVAGERAVTAAMREAGRTGLKNA